MKSVLTVITSHLNRRIRCIIWKQWKRSRKRIESLVKLGCNKEQAKAIAYSRKSHWNTSLYISKFITNARLKRRGLILSVEYYIKVHTVI